MAQVRPPRCPDHGHQVVFAAGCAHCNAERDWRIAQATARLEQYARGPR